MMMFMPGLDREALKSDLRRLIATECEKDVEAAGVDDDTVLIGGPLALDSLDALQICVEVKNRYGVRIEGGPDARRALESINTLADTILSAESELSPP
jgi:acyl carrier protein